LTTVISKVEASSHAPEYSSPSGSLSVKSESTYSMRVLLSKPIAAGLLLSASSETLVGRSKATVITSPLPNEESPSSGSSISAAMSRGDCAGSLPKSPVSPWPVTMVSTPELLYAASAGVPTPTCTGGRVWLRVRVRVRMRVGISVRVTGQGSGLGLG